MIAAGTAAERGRKVLLLDRNAELGRKLFITGKGRCNITNAAEIEDFIDRTVRNGKFLYSAFYSYTNENLMDFLRARGLQLKTERGGRVFPVSDQSSDVIHTLVRYLQDTGVTVKLDTRVKSIQANDGGVKEVQTYEGDAWTAESVLIATGGASYPLTGSTGDGYDWAEELGHTIADVGPSLVPLVTEEAWVQDLQGLSLKNVELKAFVKGKKVFSEFGEMLFTHFGVSGPLILTLSAALMKQLSKGRKPTLSLDLKPALAEDKLDKRLQRDFEKYNKKQFKNALGDLLPKKLIPVIVTLSGIDPERNVSELTREERRTLLHLLKNMQMTVRGTRPLKEAVITSGGVATKEIDPSTMESKLVKGLYFAGEVIDVDAVTGGYNLQIAWSTGHLAGENM